jgi:cytochrome P450
MALLTVAGNDTTRNSMSAAVMVQNLYPDNWAKMMADPHLIHNGVSELIRWQSPVAHMRRTATQDYEIGGKRIREGDKVVLWYLSASRDEAMYPDGDVFDPERENAKRHLSFGFGIHRCVGYRLAELQLQMLLEEMHTRDMEVELTGKPERIYGCFINGYTHLPVRITRN